MGNKLDPAKLEVSDIYDTSVCSLAKVMRKQLRKRGIRDLKVVYSKEDVPDAPGAVPVASRDAQEDVLGTVPVASRDAPGTVPAASVLPNNASGEGKTCGTKCRILGSVPFVPPVAGLIMASEVVYDLIHAGPPAL